MRPIASRLVLFFAILQLVAGCGPSARQKAIAAAFQTTNTLRDDFVHWDARHQAEIVDKATSKEDGKAKLASYREQRMHVIAAFEAVYHAIAAAVLVDSDPKSMDILLKAAGELKTAVDDIRAVVHSPSSSGAVIEVPRVL